MNDDMTKAMALQLSAEKLKSLGWKFSVEDIGRNAAKILKAMDKELETKEPIE